MSLELFPFNGVKMYDQFKWVWQCKLYALEFIDPNYKDASVILGFGGFFLWLGEWILNLSTQNLKHIMAYLGLMFLGD